MNVQWIKQDLLTIWRTKALLDASLKECERQAPKCQPQLQSSPIGGGSVSGRAAKGSHCQRLWNQSLRDFRGAVATDVPSSSISSLIQN